MYKTFTDIYRLGTNARKVCVHICICKYIIQSICNICVKYMHVQNMQNKVYNMYHSDVEEVKRFFSVSLVLESLFYKWRMHLHKQPQSNY